MMIRPIYIGVFLDAVSRAELLERVWPIHPVVYADHLTLAYKPSDAELAQYKIGEHCAMRVVAHDFDARGQAVSVELPPGSGDEGHITISCAHGTKPVYSNALLGDPEADGLGVEPFVLTGVIDTFPRTTEIH